MIPYSLSYLIFTSSILSIPLNLCFLTSTVYVLLLFFISSSEIMTFIIKIPEPPLIIARIFVERILSNLPFSSKVVKSRTLFLLLSLVQSLFCPLGKNAYFFGQSIQLILPPKSSPQITSVFFCYILSI